MITIIANPIAGKMVKKAIAIAASVDNGGSSVANIELSNANIDNDILSVIFTRYARYGLLSTNNTQA